MASPSPTSLLRIDAASPSLAERWRRFWDPPEQFLLDAGNEGEALIGRIRIGLTGVLLLIPLTSIMVAPRSEWHEHIIGFVVTLFAFVMAIAVYFMIRRDLRQPWLPMATSLFDVTLISAANLSYAFVADPHQATNSKVTFDTYFIALGATCLRYDKRVAAVAGATAIVQYAANLAFIYSNWSMQTSMSAGNIFNPYGRFQWTDQVSRIILLLTATALCVFIVGGIQRQRQLSNADSLTGVFNRRFFDDYFAAEMERAMRFRGSVAIAMIDVDHFKQFNDRFGHAAGDVALRGVARSLQLAVRRSDLVARYGGEEFVVLFREASLDQAVELVERIRQEIQSVPHTIGDARPVHVTVSAGVASWPEDGPTTGDILATADRRLFMAKDAGRNRVIGRTSAPAAAARFA
ncbi:MAG: GGDEF domain-containing protein [Gemmatimonadetes bacterium]|nr:GGDEF domain-containing protein [Gemmatimonadota bacterium]